MLEKLDRINPKYYKAKETVEPMWVESVQYNRVEVQM